MIGSLVIGVGIWFVSYVAGMIVGYRMGYWDGRQAEGEIRRKRETDWS